MHGSNLRYSIYSRLRLIFLVTKLLKKKKYTRKCGFKGHKNSCFFFYVHLKSCCRVKKVSHIILSLSTPLYWGYMCTSTPHRSFSQKRNTSSFILWLLKLGINRLCIIQARAKQNSKPRKKKLHT